jgi:hypothetical protein
MKYSANEPYAFVETDTFAMLNHEVAPKNKALKCADCHGSTARMDLAGKLGYHLKCAKKTVCTQCHSNRPIQGFHVMHTKHVTQKKYKCSRCHVFSRPERKLL